VGHELVYSLPLLELDILVGDRVMVAGMLDPGLQIVVIRCDLAKEVNAHINPNHLVEMEGANGATNWTLGCAEYLTMQVGNVPFKIHMHVVEDAPFQLLLGRLFGHTVSSAIEDLPNGETEVSVRDPADPTRRIYLPARPRKGHTTSVKILSVVGSHSNIDGSISSHLPSSCPSTLAGHHVQDAQLTPQPPPLLLPPDTTAHSLTYKKVANKVQPVAATLPEDFRNIRRIPEDPLLTLPPLPMHPPNFTPGKHLTQERLDVLGLNADGFLQPEEEKLLICVLKMNKMGLAWTEAEKGRFRDEYFS
jgi:hypothetical protein